MHKTGDLTRKLDTERGEAGNGNFLSAGYIFFFGVSCNFYFSHCFISWFLFCVARACFFFLVLLSTSSSFSFFCLCLLLSCSSVLFFFFVLRGVVSSFLDFVWGVTYCSIEGLVSRVFARSLHEYFVTWWVFSVSFLSFFLSFCVLIFFLAV